jgi:Flp pilus assembly protein CpaB
VVSQGAVKVKEVAGRPPTALTDPAQLAGKTASVAIPAGRTLTADLFPAAQTRIGTVRIPPDKTALALQMANVPGVAGFAGAGDRVDVYGVSKQGSAGGNPGARLVLQGVEVLNVNGAVLAAAQGQPGGAGLVFLVAVSPVEAERLVYLTTFEQLYFALVPKDRGAVAPTPGAGPGDSLKLP